MYVKLWNSFHDWSDKHAPVLVYGVESLEAVEGGHVIKTEQSQLLVPYGLVVELFGAEE